jgi:hypothetical protein
MWYIILLLLLLILLLSILLFIIIIAINILTIYFDLCDEGLFLSYPNLFGTKGFVVVVFCF